MTYDPKTLKNTYAYRHEVEAAEAEERKILPKKPQPKKEEKPSAASLYALLDKFKH